MAKVSIRVRSGAARFDVAVEADSVEQAISLLGERYRTSDVRVRSLASLAGFSTGSTVPRRNDLSDALAA